MKYVIISSVNKPCNVSNYLGQSSVNLFHLVLNFTHERGQYSDVLTRASN
jgi:hypothetical protein